MQLIGSKFIYMDKSGWRVAEFQEQVVKGCVPNDTISIKLEKTKLY